MTTTTRSSALAVVLTAALASCSTPIGDTLSASVIPLPVTRVDGDGRFSLGADAAISAPGDATPVGDYLAGILGIPVSDGGDVQLVIGSGPAPGGYELRVNPEGIRIEADDAAGLFAGVQTLRQLGTTEFASTTIVDHPRFAYRGAMLDVARHFFTVDAVKRYIDDIALLKLNVLHLHLTDDQGWRLEIDGWPELTAIGASTEVGGGAGGFYTQDDYREIVSYAASRYITIVPEIDLPGHTNAALSAYPELTCDGVAPAPYEGIEVGFSSLCIGNERTYEFLHDVIRDVAALTPGPWLHLGGDESLATTDDDFLTFIARATAIAATFGKTVIGWHEMGRSTELPAGTVGQYWNFTSPEDEHGEHARSFVEQGGKVIMSPANVAYLDMTYDENYPLGLTWAQGPTSVREAYEWDPATIIPGVEDEQLLGVEAPVWTETLTTIGEVETMAFPRLAGIAEIAWSPASGRSWAEYEPRLATFITVLDAAGISHGP